MAEADVVFIHSSGEIKAFFKLNAFDTRVSVVIGGTISGIVVITTKFTHWRIFAELSGVANFKTLETL
jgi:hypothetical protein